MQDCNKTVPKIGIAIVQWNHVEHTLLLLRDLTENSAFSITICDNGSDKKNWLRLNEWLTQNFSQPANSVNKSNLHITLLRNANNSGFAAGVNVCLEKLLDMGCEWLWVLNNDIRIEKTQLAKLSNELQSRSAGIYGTSISDAHGLIYLGASAYNKWTTRRKQLKHSSFLVNKNCGNWYLDGASMIIHKAVIKKIGMLSEATFLYYEELDYGKRLSNNTEFNSGLIEKIVVRHLGAGSSSNNEFKPKRMYHETWSTLSFYKRQYPNLYYLILFGRTPLRILTLCLKGRWDEVAPVFEGTIDFLKGFNRDKKNVHIIESHNYS